MRESKERKKNQNERGNALWNGNQRRVRDKEISNGTYLWMGFLDRIGGRKTRGHGVLEETANDCAPLRDVPTETSWFLYGSEGFKQQAIRTTRKSHRGFDVLKPNGMPETRKKCRNVVH